MQTWACWAGWGNKSVLEWGNVPEEVPMDTEKVTSKINEEVDSKVEDRFLKHELQMQLMAEKYGGNNADDST